MKSTSVRVEGDGLVFTISGCSDDPITRHHANSKSFYEHLPMKRLASLINKIVCNGGEYCIVDAGANIGNHTLYFGGILPSVHVFSFEMNPVTFGFLESNVGCSGLSNVTVFNYGLSSQAGRCGIRQNSENPLGGAQLDFSGHGESEVELTTLDIWKDMVNLGKRCVLIKMDVEGHELNVLKGARKLIVDNHPMIYAELKDVPQYEDFSDYLFGMGYVTAYAEDGALPNFLFVHKDDVNSLFSDLELENIKNDLCSRVVDAWQLHRKLRNYLKT